MYIHVRILSQKISPECTQGFRATAPSKWEIQSREDKFKSSQGNKQTNPGCGAFCRMTDLVYSTTQQHEGNEMKNPGGWVGRCENGKYSRFRRYTDRVWGLYWVLIPINQPWGDISETKEKNLNLGWLLGWYQ